MDLQELLDSLPADALWTDGGIEETPRPFRGAAVYRLDPGPRGGPVRLRLAALVLWVLRHVPHTPWLLVRPAAQGEALAAWLEEEAPAVACRCYRDGPAAVLDWLELRSEGTYRVIEGPFDLGELRNFDAAEGELRRLLEERGKA